MTGKTRPRLAGVRAVGERYDRSFAERAAVLAARAAAVERAVSAHRGDVAAFRDAVAAVVEPFGLDPMSVPAPLVDLLSWAVPDGEHWRWTGRTNNRGTAVMRYRGGQLASPNGSLNSEWSACRWLHRLLAGDHEPPGAMHPRCAAPFVCVRLAHRCPVCAAREGVAGGAGSVA